VALEHVMFIGGSPCAGKSTLAERITQKYGLRYYACDDRWNDHAQLADPVRQPTMTYLTSRPWAEIMTRNVDVMLRDVILVYREQWALIYAELEDISEPVMAEGAALMPELIATLEPRARAVYLVPDERFQREHYARRGWAWGLTNQTDHPERTFDGWMTRDTRFAAHVHQTALERGFPILTVDGPKTIDETQTWLEDALGLDTRA
jgi:2-phosphoglycerate kinase